LGSCAQARFRRELIIRIATKSARYVRSLFGPARRTILFQIRHSSVKLVMATARSRFSLSPVSARYSTPHRDRLISLVDSIPIVPFLIVPVSQGGAPLFTIKFERDKPRANFASAPAGPQFAVQWRRGELLDSHLCTNIEQAAHQGALMLRNPSLATKLRASKNHVGTWFWSRGDCLLSRNVQALLGDRDT
jgi:hypothetical protein